MFVEGKGYSIRHLMFIVISVVLFLSLARLAQAQGSPAADTIPPGTKITSTNWQQYKQFMPVGMQALLSGSYFWHLPKDFVIEVGPTRPFPLPKLYMEATEKYGSQVTLERLPTGGYAPKGYIAGLPFADPLKGDPALIGQRVFWNAFYHYQPRVQAGENQFSYIMDKYGNMTQTGFEIGVFSQLAHVTDPGYPLTVPAAGPYYLAKLLSQLEPEQGKYFTILDLIPTDPTKFDEFYEYVPSLRRSLRVSEAARCGPLFGTDDDIDDDNEGPPGLPQLYNIAYEGQHKFLNLIHANDDAFRLSTFLPASLSPQYYSAKGDGITPFALPSMGQWELRDSYVVSLTRLPQFARGYCYGKRVLYIDKENYFTNNFEVYDNSGKLYKWITEWYAPVAIPGTNDITVGEITNMNTYTVNFQDEHLSFFAGAHGCVNSDCESKGWLDVGRWADPAGLAKIAQ